MVTGPSLTDDERAQLVLVGSVAIAFIIISLVVVFNTVLFTNNLAARGSVEEVEDASTFQQQVEREVPELVRHVENGTASNAALVGNVDENVSGAYSGLLAESYADTSPKYADVRFNRSSTVNGTRVVQDDSSEFRTVSGSQHWYPVETGDRRNVSDFVIVANSSLENELSTDNFTVTIENSSGTTISLHMVSGSGDLLFTQKRNGGIENACTVTGVDEEVVVNVSDGVVIGDTTCSFASLDTVTGPYSIQFENGSQIQGNYTFVAEGKINRGVYGDRNGNVPYANHLLLEAGVDLYFESRTVTYESNQTVTVREGPQ